MDEDRKLTQCSCCHTHFEVNIDSEEDTCQECELDRYSHEFNFFLN